MSAAVLALLPLPSSPAANAVETTVVLTAPAVSTYPLPLTVDAAVTPSQASGWVTIEAADGTEYGRGLVGAGVAHVELVLPLGDYDLSAHYLGNSTYSASDSAAIGIVSKIWTITSIRPPNTGVARIGELIELQANTFAAGSFALDRGTLSLIDLETNEVLDSADAPAADGELEVRALVRVFEAGASHRFVARFEGAGQLADSEQVLDLAILKRDTTTTIVFPEFHGEDGGPYTFTAQIWPIPEGGDVLFKQGGTEMATVEVDSHGRATITLADPKGPEHLDAIFSGSDWFKASNTAVQLPMDITPPSGTVLINGGAQYTNNPDVTLGMWPTDADPSTGVSVMALSDTADPPQWAWQGIRGEVAWTFTGPDGTKSVFGRFRDASWNPSAVIQASIVLDREAPIASQAMPSLATGTTVGSKIPVLVAFGTTDVVSGVATYRLDMSSDGGSTYSPIALTEGQTGANRSLAPGAKIYCFRTSATDRAENANSLAAGPCFTVRALQQNAAATSLAGAWTRKSSSSAWGGSFIQSSSAGATFSTSVSGRYVGLVARVGPGMGKAVFAVDGVETVVDLYAPTIGWRRIIAVRPLATGSAHNVSVRVLGTKNAASTGKTVVVDGLVVLQ